jgi:hypothetical protein
MMRFIIAGAILAFGFIVTTGWAQMSGNSCSQLNGKCVAYCKGNPDRTGCMPDCNQAMAECMKSGNWNTAQTHLSGLKKK